MARIEEIQKIVRRCAEANGFSVYLPSEHTHPEGAPDMTAPEVYWIDRERVASSDLVLIFADEPSFGVGQEAEIAANAGVPIAIFRTEDKLSRMLRGIAGRIIADIKFNGFDELETLASEFFHDNKSRLKASRSSRDQEYHLRVGNRIREQREADGLSIEKLAENAEVNAELIETIETRPEKLSNTSLVNLRRIAKALDIAPAELLKDQSGKEQEFEDQFRASVVNLRKYSIQRSLPYITYAQLKTRGRKSLREHFDSSARAARGTGTIIKEGDWEKAHIELIKSDSGDTSTTSPISEE